MINESFWAGRRVLVTGHTGFKGSWLTLMLERLGARVTGFSLGPVSDPSLFDVAGIASSMDSIFGDVRDIEAMRAVMAAASPEVILHLAAQPLVRYSYQDPLTTFSTNVMGTVNVLEAARNVPGVRSIVMITSDKCYENHEWEWAYREDDQLGGADPYSASKASAEIVISSYRRSFYAEGANIASTRAGNVIGGGDFAQDRLVPDVMRAALQNETVRIRNPQSLRPWQHVLNPLSGYLVLAERLYEGASFSTAYNFGPGEHDTPPAGQVVGRLCSMWGDDLQWTADPGPHPHEAGLLRLDSSRADTRLGWRPTWMLEEGLQRIVDWYRAYGDGEDMRKMTLTQIEDFLAAF